MTEYQDLDLYSTLGLKKECSNNEIRKAYRKKALVSHPDKATDDKEREKFTVKFQKIAFAYSILSDEKKRERYDRTGSVEDADLDEASLKDLFSMCKSVISKEIIELDKKQYREGGEEYDDIIKYYKESEGDFDVIMENVLHCNVLDDEERIREIIWKAIKEGSIPAFKSFTKESKAAKQKRKREAKKEAVEAEELAKELNIKPVGGEDELALMIKKKHAKTFDSLIERLEEKYTKETKSKKVKKAKAGV